jgi:hypothetical protein
LETGAHLNHPLGSRWRRPLATRSVTETRRHLREMNDRADRAMLITDYYCLERSPVEG